MLEEYDIKADNYQNIDKKGHAKGRAKSSQPIYTFKYEMELKRRDFKLDDQYTIIKCILAAGKILDPFIIIKNTITCYRDFLEFILLTQGFTQIEKGWVNKETALMQLIRHFNIAIKPRRESQQRCLVLDGYSTHKTKQFIKYCYNNKIKIALLPSYSSQQV